MARAVRCESRFLPFRNALFFFVEGESAFRSGLARHATSYADGARERTAWLAGWDSAEEEARDLDPLRRHDP